MKAKDYIKEKIAELERDRDYHMSRQTSVGQDKVNAKAERDDIQNVLDTKPIGPKARAMLESRVRGLDTETKDLDGEQNNVGNRISGLSSIVGQLKDLWDLLP